MINDGITRRVVVVLLLLLLYVPAGTYSYTYDVVVWCALKVRCVRNSGVAHILRKPLMMLLCAFTYL